MSRLGRLSYRLLSSCLTSLLRNAASPFSFVASGCGRVFTGFPGTFTRSRAPSPVPEKSLPISEMSSPIPNAPPRQKNPPAIIRRGPAGSARRRRRLRIGARSPGGARRRFHGRGGHGLRAAAAIAAARTGVRGAGRDRGGAAGFDGQRQCHFRARQAALSDARGCRGARRLRRGPEGLRPVRAEDPHAARHRHGHRQRLARPRGLGGDAGRHRPCGALRGQRHRPMDGGHLPSVLPRSCRCLAGRGSRPAGRRAPGARARRPPVDQGAGHPRGSLAPAARGRGALSLGLLRRRALARGDARSDAPPKTPKSKTPKSKTPKSKTPKSKTPKAEMPKPETPKPETPKPETPKAKMPRTKTPAGTPAAKPPRTRKA